MDRSDVMMLLGGSIQKYGPNLALNPNFETAGAGGADVFASWTESVSIGSIAKETVDVPGGYVAACKITTPGAADEYVLQSFDVEAGKDYLFSFWTHGNGTSSGRYNVVDNTHSANIITGETGIPGTTYIYKSYNITIPAGCTSIYIQLLSNWNNVSYFSGVVFKKKL